MSYLTQSKIASSPTMHARVAQCVASEDEIEADPDYWASTNARDWAAAPGWAAAWEYAIATHPDEPDYDPAADEAVITDEMILSQVQLMNEVAGPKDGD